MHTNGRSFYVSTSSSRQRQLWQRLFQVDTLPVTTPWPHEAVSIDGRLHTFYTLDTHRMSAGQLHRLASHITARQPGQGGYVKVLDRLRMGGWQIDATYCELVETAELKRPSLSVWRPRAPLLPLGAVT